MLTPPGTPVFYLTLDGAETRSDFRVLHFKCRERFNQPYELDLELVHEDPNLDPKTFLHKSAFLTYGASGEKFYGLIHRFAQGDKHQRWTRYTLHLTSPLTYLQHRTNQRIFQNRTVPQIITQVLRDNYILTNYFTFIPSNALYPPREYCTQHETDLKFIQRLCEEEHIQFHFEHGESAVHLYFGDSHSAFPMPKQPTVYKPESGLLAEEPVIRSFNLRTETRTSWVTRRDYNFLTPSKPLETAFKGWDLEAAKKLPDYEDYSYPGAFDKDDKRSKQLVSRIQERHRSDYELATATSNHEQLHAGHLMQMTGHSRADWNDYWLVTDITHEGHQPQVLEESMPADLAQSSSLGLNSYSNKFEATPARTVYRPPITVEKPRMYSSQTARVTGPAGEEIHTNALAQVRVQFHWDREGVLDEGSSCWLRVATSWAGNGYGGLSIPRVGMEVLVNFLDGDPDQPIVIGCLYNGANDVPYPLPANKTRSVFKTASSKGGGGSNEVRIEDQKGAEEIYVNAERDWNQRVGNDYSTDVGQALNLSVKGLATEALKDQLHTTVTGNRVTQIQAEEHLRIAGSQHIQTANHLVGASGQIHLNAAQTTVITSGLGTTVTGGGQWITLTPAGIYSSVPIQLGGAPLPGMPAVPLLPGQVLPVVPALLPGVMSAASVVTYAKDGSENSTDSNPESEPEEGVCESCMNEARDLEQMSKKR